MRRGKDEEKIIGPMFPRLHVNDTEKGGPKAPPRNKMALYEQLSIPSHRFSRGVLPLNPASNTAASSIQGGGNEKGAFLPRQLPARHQAEEAYSQYSDLSNPLTQVGLKKKSDEDDCTVPIFIHSRPSQDPSKNFNDVERKKLPPSKHTNPNPSMKFVKNNHKSMIGHGMRKESKTQKEENLKEFVACQNPLVKAFSNSSSTNKAGGLQKQRHDPGNSIDRVKNCRIQSELSAESQPASTVHGNVVLKKHGTDIEKRNSSIPMKDFSSEEENIVYDTSNDAETPEDRGDCLSETSMVDSISGFDFSPDDVVGVIGQKHFWKARRAIVHQQKVFAVQVFELHRLLKVQRSIAGSPHLLLEDAAYLGKPVKALPAEKLPLDYNVKMPLNVSKRKMDSDKPSPPMECSAENTVEKASVSSVQYSLPPFSGNPPAPSVSGANNFGPWCFNQPNGHQWLIPVMTPEGLVYKPYPGPGFMGPVCGGYGPHGSTPAHGFLAPHYQYQLPSFPTAGPHGYFSPYGMPLVNPAFSGSSVEQVNHVTMHDQLSAEEANSSPHHQHSFNMPSQKCGIFPDVSSLNVSKDSELKALTPSNPRENGKRNAGEGRNMLRLFPTSPSLDIPNCSPQPLEPECPARVIKVVPHNAMSATESAARIFMSIQEERKQYDSV
ncbi:protein EARLY FLOWERING 3-like [Olea europaea var. sylvestris]|uniref:protein EARLY FLOWERING 3-like n=1 Tax=Olea europaea var. sylvestris TaxID=158386 RepID=UPI000C1D3EE0|nr:protein EARLY FLOWERING 3-like [Olea europaea var. sylvestris]XP_022872054.1 protein EARLY FLOWERING 3-like [Olea europaea var. sylvestris]XP_022872055.1 protein EARLY FLOWERING 3-like [Olea europaea var. sylvestris]